jgi:hypothetical protein
VSCSGLIFTHNTIDAIGVEATSMVNLTDSNISDVEVTDNMLAGGGYALVAQWRSGPSLVVSNNHVVDGSYAYWPFSDEVGDCAHWAEPGNAGNNVVTVDESYSITEIVRQYNCLYPVTN